MSTAGRLSIRQTRPIVRPGTTLVMNSFSPLTTNSFASPLGPGAQRGQIGAGAGLGQGECRKPFAAGQLGQESPFLFRRAEGSHRIDRADAAVHRGQPGDRGIEHRHLA